MTLTLREWDRCLDCRLLAWPDRRSYTRQPTVELHLPISCQPITSALMTQLLNAGARMAKPGEFTLRAFLAGQLDLAQAEGVLGLIEAENLSQLQQAIDQRAGGISRPIVSARSELLELLAELEAGLDFVEEDIQFISDEQLDSRLSKLHHDLTLLRQSLVSRDRADAVPKVVLVGAPNAGKSSLFNLWSAQRHAIVSSQAGTTRDYVTFRVNTGKHTFDLIDTAGWEVGQDAVSALAQESRQTVTRTADLRLACIPSDQTVPDLSAFPQPTVVVRTKADLLGNEPQDALSFVSALKPDESKKRLEQLISSQLELRTVPEWGTSLGDRCRNCLDQSLEQLEEALSVHSCQLGQEYVAVHLRGALDALAEIVGEVYTDDLLDQIFSKFCIGK